MRLLRKIKRRTGDRVRRPVGQYYIIGSHSDCACDGLIKKVVVVVNLQLLSIIVVVVRDNIVVDVVIGEISLDSVFIISNGLIMAVSMLQAPVIVIRVLM